MFSKWRERLRHAFGFRLAWWYAVLFLVSSAALVAVTYLLLALTLRQHDRETVESTLVQFAAAYRRGGTEGLAREIQQTQVAGTTGPMFVRVLSRRQELLFFSLPERWRQFDLAQLSTPPLSGGENWATLETGGDDGEVLEVLSVRLGDGSLFQVGRSTERRADLLRRFRHVLLFNLASILAVGLAGGAALTWSALRPVRALTDTVGSILRTGRTTARVEQQGQEGTLGDLAALVNAMLDRIDAVVAGMRGALDNVAHDLRTPLARLRGIAESGSTSNDPALLRAALMDCIDETDRIIAMLDTLMDISEAETGTMALRVQRTSLRDLVRQAVDLYEDVAEEAGVTIEATVPAEIEVTVDPPRMRQVLANLLDNAVKYTPRGGHVRIDASSPHDEVRIAVEDTGAGIAADELPHIWARLYRGDKSRSTRGLGLGLSLVKAIVEAHGGRILVESAPGSGSRFEIRLPRTRENLSPM